MGQIIVGERTVKRRLRRALALFDGRDVIEILMQGGFVFEEGAKRRVTKALMTPTGNLRASIEAQPAEGGRLAVEIGPRGVVYAAIHEFGGVTHPKVTPRMRGFAFHKFKETGDPMWLAIALTKKTRLTVRIKARPYLRPTFDEDSDKAEDAIEAEIDRRLTKEFGR